MIPSLAPVAASETLEKAVVIWTKRSIQRGVSLAFEIIQISLASVAFSCELGVTELSCDVSAPLSETKVPIVILAITVFEAALRIMVDLVLLVMWFAVPHKLRCLRVQVMESDLGEILLRQWKVIG